MNGKRRGKETSERLLDEDKILPQAVEMENAVLGAILLESQTAKCQSILSYIQPEQLYSTQNQLVCQAILDLHAKDVIPDILTTYEQLKATGNAEASGGHVHLSEITANIASSQNIAFHYRVVYNQYLKRKLIEVSSRVNRSAYDDSDDIFVQIETLINELDKARPEIYFKPTSKANDVGQTFIEEFFNEDPDNHNVIFMTYNTGHKRFDSVVTISSNKIIVIGGAPKAGKSKFIEHIMFGLCESFADVSVYWVSLEDSEKDILNTYLSSKVRKKPKEFDNPKRFHDKYKKKYDEEVLKWTNVFRKFDIVFRDQTIGSKEITSQFSQFCNDRQGRFNICVIDNVLTLDDKERFQGDLPGMMDYIYRQILVMKKRTKGLIFAIHHYNSEQRDEHHVDKGYRPRLRNLKGGEASERTANQVILINNPGKFKDLLGQYSGDAKEVLKHMFIIDVGANRHDGDDDDIALIHMMANLDYCIFKEIDIPDKVNEKIVDPLSNELPPPKIIAF
jgi:replicative DNA helicase